MLDNYNYFRITDVWNKLIICIFSILLLTGSVNNVTANVGVNSIELAWLSPTNASDDGILSGYNITCTETNNTITTNTQLTIYTLMPFTQYTCCIEPQWSTNGVGPSVCIQQKTLQDGQSIKCTINE